MSNFIGRTTPDARLADFKLRRIGTEDVVEALRQGWSDFLEKPSHYAFLVLIYPIMGAVIGVWTSGNNALPLLYPLVTGFALLGPIAALGLYEISRRRERGLDTSWRHAFDVLHSPQIRSILAFSIVLMAIFIVWLFSAQALYNWTHASQMQSSLATFVSNVFGTAEGRTLLFVGNIVGAAFAAFVLSIASSPSRCCWIDL